MKNGAHLLLFCDVTSLYVRILHVNYVPYNFYYTLMLATTVKALPYVSLRLTITIP